MGTTFQRFLQILELALRHEMIQRDWCHCTATRVLSLYLGMVHALCVTIDHVVHLRTQLTDVHEPHCVPVT